MDSPSPPPPANASNRTQKTVLYATIGLVALNLIVGALLTFKAPTETRSPELSSLREAIDTLPGSARLYFTPNARAGLEQHATGAPLAAAPYGTAAAAETVDREFARAAQEPDFFRKLDRKHHFDAVLLAGDPGGYRPLLRHLIESRDWVFTHLDHTSIVFRRPPAELWREETIDEKKARFEKAGDRAQFLAQAASRLLAAGRTGTAKRCLEEALSLDRKSPDVWTQLALHSATTGRWQEALVHANEALALDGDHPPALSAKAQVLYGLGRFDDALPVAEKVVAAFPHDPGMLFLHAKIAHEAHAYFREIESLRRLIALAEKQGQPASGYRIYLAQAHAAAGEARPALEEFEKAAATGDLSPEQRQFVQESIERIRSRAQL